MDKRQILNSFLKKGIMLSPEDLEKMNKENYRQILEDKEDSDKNYVVITPKSGNISTQNFMKIQNNNFEFLRKIILKKTEAVSINKARKIFSEVTIIGRVKDSAERGFVIEDVTGETDVYGEKDNVKQGDVLALKGHFKDNKFFASETSWPDIPLDNIPQQLKTKLVLTPKPKEFKEALVICPGSKNKEGVVSGFSKFAAIKLPNNGKDFVVVFYSPEKETSEEEAVMVLKKRKIQDEKIINNLIEEVPGIFWLCENKKDWTKNYKGVIIISTGNGSYAYIVKGEVKYGKI